MKDFDEKLEEMLIQYKKCTDDKKRKLLHIKIIEIALSYVKKIVSLPLYRSYGIQEDLFQVGSIGLLKAIDFYDVNKNTKFKTYATYFIKGEIKHYLRDKASFIKPPREVQEIYHKLIQAKKELNDAGLDSNSAQLLAQKLSLNEEKVENILQSIKDRDILSLDQSSKDEDEEITLIEKIPDGDYKDFLSNSENRFMLNSAISQLPEDLKEILILNYYNDLNQREIAQKLGISVMQVSRKIKKGLNTLYKIIKESEK